MDRIPSFEKNHNILMPGMYFSTYQKGIATFDLRFKRPNEGDYVSAAASHTIEHLLATTLRNGTYKDNIIYFGPMGCRTGFYLLTSDMSYRNALDAVKESVQAALQMNQVPGAKKIECGNYRSHDLKRAKQELQKYSILLDSITEEQILLQEQKFEAAK